MDAQRAVLADQGAIGLQPRGVVELAGPGQVEGLDRVRADREAAIRAGRDFGHDEGTRPAAGEARRRRRVDRIEPGAVPGQGIAEHIDRVGFHRAAGGEEQLPPARAAPQRIFTRQRLGAGRGERGGQGRDALRDRGFGLREAGVRGDGGGDGARLAGAIDVAAARAVIPALRGRGEQQGNQDGGGTQDHGATVPRNRSARCEGVHAMRGLRRAVPVAPSG